MGRNIAIIGAGSWGTALSVLLAKKNLPVRLWARRAQMAKRLQAERENKKYLPGIKLPENILVTNSLKEAIEGSELVVLAVPSVGVRAVTRRMEKHLDNNMILLNAAKGLEEKTGMRISEVMLEMLPKEFENRLVVLSGPNLAIEVVRDIPTATVIAAKETEVARYVQGIFNGPTFRAYTSSDIIGVELGGALKNIIAIGAGINDGLGFGDNTKAALATRGLAEIVRLGVALGAKAATFSGLSGTGDLFATCASRHSRNWQVGFQLAQGKPLDSILSGMDMVAEGVPTTVAAYKLARQHNVEMPITFQIYQVLFQRKSPKEAVTELMLREMKPELPEI